MPRPVARGASRPASPDPDRGLGRRVPRGCGQAGAGEGADLVHASDQPRSRLDRGLRAAPDRRHHRNRRRLAGLAVYALATSGTVFRAPLVVVLLFCLGCITTLALGPQLVLPPFVDRSDRVRRSFSRVGEQMRVSRSTFIAGGFLFGCWTTRAFGCTPLLSALGAGDHRR
jgi:hypothetical protein